MKGLLAILGKDTRNLFLSPLFWAIGGLCTLIWSGLYLVTLKKFSEQSFMMQMQNQGQGGANIHEHVFVPHISSVNFIIILAVAALTIRLFAEEKKSRTIDLLLTSPVTATHIVAGKFLAGLLAAWALVFVSFLYPLSMAIFAKFDWGPLLSTYLGTLLLTACYVAVGMFASSLTESAVLAVLMSLIFSVGLWFVGAGTELVDSPIWASIFDHVSIGNHFSAFVRGTFGIASTVFFLSVIALYCFLTQRVVESARWR